MPITTMTTTIDRGKRHTDDHPTTPTERLSASELASLVAQARLGCEQAEVRLFTTHHRLLLGIARNYGLDEHDCADVAQRSWLKARQALSSLRNDDRFKQWISAIARNESFKTLRRRSRETSLPSDQIDGSVEWDPDATLIRFEDLQQMRAAVDRLGAADRTLVRLLFDEGMSYRQVAEELGCPPGCVGPNRGRMLTRLRRLMVEQNRPESLAG